MSMPSQRKTHVILTAQQQTNVFMPWTGIATSGRGVLTEGLAPLEMDRSVFRFNLCKIVA